VPLNPVHIGFNVGRSIPHHLSGFNKDSFIFLSFAGGIFEWNYWVYGRADLDDIKSGFQGKLNSSLE
jgi:hypothetical protein